MARKLLLGSIIVITLIIGGLIGYFALISKEAPIINESITNKSIDSKSIGNKCSYDSDCLSGHICNQACSTIGSGMPPECAKKTCFKECASDEDCPQEFPLCKMSIRWTGDSGTPIKLCQK